MNTRPRVVLVVGATGSVGRLVVEESIRQGYATRALVRDAEKARRLPSGADIVVSDVTRPDTLPAAVAGIDAVVFTHGSDGAGKVGAENVDYSGVGNVLTALDAQPARIALMTSVGVTNRTNSYNRATEAHDWKRRSERLVRAAGGRTRSCVPDGSTTTTPTNCGSSCRKATSGRQATPATASSPDARSPRSSCRAWAQRLPPARPSNWLPNLGRRRRTSTPSSLGYSRTRRDPSTVSTTSKTCH